MCLAALALGVMTTTCAVADKATSAQQAQIEEIAKNVMAKGPYPGMALAIWKNGEIFYENGFGMADLENDIPVTPDTVFPIGSITKSFTGLSIMQLVDAGKVSLDATVKQYLTDYDGTGSDITLRHLLNHTSGIPNYTSLPEFPKSPRRDYSHEEMMAFWKDKDPLFQPGDKWSYSNSNTFLLGMIIERVSGKSYAEYLQDNIFTPFGLTNTYYFDYTRLIKHRGEGYKRGPDGWVNATDWSPSVPFSAGAIMSTVGDLLKYRQAVFSSDKVNDNVRRLILSTDKLNDGTDVYYALGCLIRGELDGHEKISHSGDVYGFASHYAYYPEDDVTVALLTNNQGASVPPASIEHKFARVALGEDQPVIKDDSLSAKKLERFTGNFEIKPFEFGPPVYGFVAKDGKLHLQYAGVGSGAPLIPLLYQGKDTFVSALDDEHVFRFDVKKGKARGFQASYYDGTIHGAYLAEKSK